MNDSCYTKIFCHKRSEGRYYSLRKHNSSGEQKVQWPTLLEIHKSLIHRELRISSQYVSSWMLNWDTSCHMMYWYAAEVACKRNARSLVWRKLQSETDIKQTVVPKMSTRQQCGWKQPAKEDEILSQEQSQCLGFHLKWREHSQHFIGSRIVQLAKINTVDDIPTCKWHSCTVYRRTFWCFD